MKDALYESITPADSTNVPTGQPGRKLFSFSDPIRWYLLALIVYAAGAIGTAVWVCLGPRVNMGEVVLQVGNVPVKQLYSAIALSCLLTPAAIVLRQIAHDLALLQPLAIASAQPMRLSHLDTAINPGLWAAISLIHYSAFAGLSQIFLLVAGATLVPIGTLMITTGDFSAPAERTAVVGMPILQSPSIVLVDDATGLPAVVNVFNQTRLDDDLVLQPVLNIVVGVLTQLMGKLPQYDHTLGPIPSSNVTYEDGVIYHGVVTYSWKSGCAYTNETQVTIDGAPWGEDDFWVNATVDFPDETVAPRQVTFPSWEMFNTTIPNSDPLKEFDFVSYFAVGGVDNYTVNWGNLPPGTQHHGRSWTASIKCTPSFTWNVSSCTFKNGSMTACVPTPGKNVTALDEAGLNFLPAYFSRLPGIITELDIRLAGAPLLAIPTLHDESINLLYYRARGPEDFDKVYGLFAQSIATITSAGYLGTVVVPTSGLPTSRVYIARIYIIPIVLFILVFAPAVALLDIFIMSRRGRPLHRATFLSIANAVRGPWWDRLLWGNCTLSPGELQSVPEISKSYVMFGVDESNPQHIGLAPDVRPIEKDTLYFGVRKEKLS